MRIEYYSDIWGVVNDTGYVPTFEGGEAGSASVDVETTWFDDISDGIEESLTIAAIASTVKIITAETPTVLMYIGDKLCKLSDIMKRNN